MRILFTFIIVSLVLSFCCEKRTQVSEKSSYLENRALTFSLIDKLYDSYPTFKKPSANTSKLLISDFDHTIADTLTRIPITLSSGKQSSVASKCAKFPENSKPNFSVFTKQALDDTLPNTLCIKRLKKETNPHSMLVVITARSQKHTFTSVIAYAKKLGLDVSLVIPVNSKILHESLWSKIKGKHFSSGMKKALLIAAVSEYVKKISPTLGEVVYFEDTDKYLTTSLKLFIQADFNFKYRSFDYLKNPKNQKYKERNLGYIENHLLHLPGGLVVKSIQDYHSKDCPL